MKVTIARTKSFNIFCDKIFINLKKGFVFKMFNIFNSENFIHCILILLTLPLKAPKMQSPQIHKQIHCKNSFVHSYTCVYMYMYFACMCECMCTICMWIQCPERLEDCVRPPAPKFTDDCEKPFVCWEPNLCPLEKSPVLLAKEPSLQF